MENGLCALFLWVNMKVNLEKLNDQLQSAVAAAGCSLWGSEFISRRGKGILRVYIESDTGVDVKACTKVTEQVSRVLDVEDPFLSSYILEVSSPGVERPLFTWDHYKQNQGKEMKLRLRRSGPGDPKNMTGVLERLDEEAKQLTYRVDGEEQNIAFDSIEKANLLFKWSD